MTIPTWLAIVIGVVAMGGSFAFGVIAYRKQHGSWPW
jgi:hypothetical protein